ncbi:hypothetical protein SLG_18360 [Sphingobium sp. SYK-6]|nr:hypothetical protein SLG_18360 [Sphingobium sp. SYK-6]
MATRLLAATLKGVKIFERGGAEADWALRGSALDDKHISAILYEPRSGLILAGTHWNQGLYVSRDGGFTFEPSMNGIARPHIYALAAQHRGEQTIIFAGTEPPEKFPKRLPRWRSLECMKRAMLIPLRVWQKCSARPCHCHGRA